MHKLGLGLCILSCRAHPAHVSRPARACVGEFYVPQVLRGQHGLAAARGGANLGLRRSSQRSMCAASLLHCDEAKSRVLQVRRALSKRRWPSVPKISRNCLVVLFTSKVYYYSCVSLLTTKHHSRTSGFHHRLSNFSTVLLHRNKNFRKMFKNTWSVSRGNAIGRFFSLHRYDRMHFNLLFRVTVSINDLVPGFDRAVYAEKIALSRKYIRDIDKLISREKY